MPTVSVTDFIPHRPPMLLIDDIVSCCEQEIVCRKTFRDDEFFIQGHYPDYPIVPGVILCECAAQAGAILLARHHIDNRGDNRMVPVLTRMNQVRFKKTVFPNDQIEITVRLNEKVAGAYFLSAGVRRDGKLAVSLEFACTLAPKSSSPPDTNSGASSISGHTA